MQVMYVAVEMLKTKKYLVSRKPIAIDNGSISREFLSLNCIANHSATKEASIFLIFFLSFCFALFCIAGPIVPGHVCNLPRLR